jgi:peroxiredoxin
MKSFLFFALFFIISINSFAQSPDSAKLPAQTTRYLLPDGKIVGADKLDSVLASWNHRPFSMVHYDDKPGIIGLLPQTAAMKKQYADERMTSNVMLNQLAPDFELPDIYGQKHRLSELKGKVVVLNFWFTSCAPCRAEMPELDSVKKYSDPQKVIFLALALDNAAAVRSFLHIQEFDYDLLPNARAVHAAYKITSCPTSMVVDKSGVIRFIQSSGDKIEEALSAAIKAEL